MCPLQSPLAPIIMLCAIKFSTMILHILLNTQLRVEILTWADNLHYLCIYQNKLMVWSLEGFILSRCAGYRYGTLIALLCPDHYLAPFYFINCNYLNMSLFDLFLIIKQHGLSKFLFDYLTHASLFLDLPGNLDQTWNKMLRS